MQYHQVLKVGKSAESTGAQLLKALGGKVRRTEGGGGIAWRLMASITRSVLKGMSLSHGQRAEPCVSICFHVFFAAGLGVCSCTPQPLPSTSRHSLQAVAHLASHHLNPPPPPT